MVLLALLQSLPAALEAWEVRQWPSTPVEWLRLALLPAALWLYARYFGNRRCRTCGSDDEIR